MTKKMGAHTRLTENAIDSVLLTGSFYDPCPNCKVLMANQGLIIAHFNRLSWKKKIKIGN